MALIDIRSSDRIIVSGLTGTGKTYLLSYFASQFAPDILIVDPLNQYSQFPDELRYVPKRETPQELEDICKSLFARSNCTLIIEEAEQYLQQGRAMLQYTSGLIRMGRNWGIGIFATTRRIQDVSKRFFDLAQHAFFFQCGLQSRDYIANMIGKEYVWETAIPKYNNTGYTITTLPKFHFLHLDLRNEVADVGVLEVEGREHIKTVGETSEVSTMEKLKGKSEAEPKEEPQEATPKAIKDVPQKEGVR